MSRAAAEPEVVELRDGSRALIRSIRPEDKRGIVEGLEHMSDDSRYKRFMTLKERLTSSELRYLTEVDHHDHEALIAADPDTREPLGVARYVRSAENPELAEAAVAIVDHRQGLGLGRALLDRLAGRARTEGISRFSATVLGENRKMIRLLEGAGPVEFVNAGSGVLEAELELPPEMGGDRPLSRTLRAAAAGDVELEPKARTAVD